LKKYGHLKVNTSPEVKQMVLPKVDCKRIVDKKNELIDKVVIYDNDEDVHKMLEIK